MSITIAWQDAACPKSMHSPVIATEEQVYKLEEESAGIQT